MYTKKQLQTLRDSMMAKKATDTVLFTEEGDLFRFAINILIIDCDPDYVKNKICECAKFDPYSYGLLYQLFFGDPIILPRYLDSIFSIIVRWRLDLGEKEYSLAIK